MSASKNLLTALSSFVREHPLWAVGLIPFGVVAVDLLVASNGNPVVFGYILQNIDVLPVVLSQTLPMVPITLIFLWMYWLLTPTTIIRKGTWSGLINSIAALLLIVLAYFAMPLLHILAAAGFLAMLAFIRVRDRRLAKKAHPGDAADTDYVVQPTLGRQSVQLILAVFVLIQVLAFSWVWIPPEIVAIKGRKPTTGQVLSSTHEWTTYIERGAQVAIRIVPTKDVESRKPCWAGKGGMALFNSIHSAIDYTQWPEDHCPGN
jgi:hypothetical protein